MPSKPIELPPDVAKAFVKDMRAYHPELYAIKRDEIAARQAWLLAQRAGKEKASPRRREGDVSGGEGLGVTNGSP